MTMPVKRVTFKGFEGLELVADKKTKAHFPAERQVAQVAVNFAEAEGLIVRPLPPKPPEQFKKATVSLLPVPLRLTRIEFSISTPWFDPLNPKPPVPVNRMALVLAPPLPASMRAPLKAIP